MELQSRLGNRPKQAPRTPATGSEETPEPTVDQQKASNIAPKETQAECYKVFRKGVQMSPERPNKGPNKVPKKEPEKGSGKGSKKASQPRSFVASLQTIEHSYLNTSSPALLLQSLLNPLRRLATTPLSHHAFKERGPAAWGRSPLNKPKAKT